MNCKFCRTKSTKNFNEDLMNNNGECLVEFCATNEIESTTTFLITDTSINTHYGTLEDTSQL